MQVKIYALSTILRECANLQIYNLYHHVMALGSSMVDVVASYNYAKESQEDWVSELVTVKEPNEETTFCCCCFLLLLFLLLLFTDSKYKH